MNRGEAVGRIQTMLAFRSDLVSTIQNALVDAQTDLEAGAMLPWFLRSELSTTQTTIGEERVPVPDDFLRECDDADLVYFKDSSTYHKWRPLLKREYNWLRAFWNSRSGQPKMFALVGPYLRIFPTPDDAYYLKMIYFKKDTSLAGSDDSVTNGWLTWANELLLGKAGLKVSVPARDQAAQAEFTNMITRGMASLVAQDTAREVTGETFQMGGPD